MIKPSGADTTAVGKGERSRHVRAHACDGVTMPFDVWKWMRSFFARIFPEREIYFRSHGAVRYVTLSTVTQLFFAVLLVGGAAFAGYAAVRSFTAGPNLASSGDAAVAAQVDYDRRLGIMSRENRRLQAELEDSQRRFEAVMRQLSSRQGELGDEATLELALNQELEATRRRLRDVTEQRDQYLTELEDARLSVIDMERRLAETQRLAQERQEHLQDFVSTMDSTVAERDDARQRVRSLAEEVARLTENVEDIRRHQGQVMAQLEEATRASLGELERILERADVDVDALLEELERTHSGEGGPFIPIDYRVPEAANGFPINEASVDEALSLLQRINSLRIAVERLPLGRPILAAHRFTSGFGPRRHPVTGRWAMHRGLDLAAPRGTPVYAPVDGVVIYAARLGGYGNVVKVRHALGYETRYAHLHVIHVQNGQAVARGELLGEVGTTGMSTGNHLHYEIRRYGTPLNPRRFIEAGRDVF